MSTDPLAEDRMFVAEELRDALAETTLSYGDRNRAAWALVDWLTTHDAQVRADEQSKAWKCACPDDCDCDGYGPFWNDPRLLLTQVRAAERERIAAAIENERDNPVRGWNDYNPSDVRETSAALLTGMREGMTTAATAARTFGGER